VAFEKPMATSLREAAEITRLCKENNIKTVVSHQQKYLTSMQAMKKVVDSGDIGGIVQMNVSTIAWMAQLGTHFMDYAMWANNGAKAKWVAGHIHGKGKLTDSHPSPDYIMGQVEFENGVRLFLENGYLSKSNVNGDMFWVDNRLTIYCTKGYAWAETDGAWGACINGELKITQGDKWVEQEPGLQTPYFRDFTDWLDDDSNSIVHPCNVAMAYHGYEILESLCLSALDNKPVYFPVNPDETPDIIGRRVAVCEFTFAVYMPGCPFRFRAVIRPHRVIHKMRAELCHPCDSRYIHLHNPAYIAGIYNFFHRLH
jgi:predicted dehydrogenase